MSKKSILLYGIFFCYITGMIFFGNVKIVLAEPILDQVQPNCEIRNHRLA